MAYLPEDGNWVEGIYQVETADSVKGGPEEDAIANKQAIELGNRTRYLKTEVDRLDQQKQDKGDPSGTADKLATARTISLSGDVAGSISFDGSSDQDMDTTLSATGVAPGTYGSATEMVEITVDSKGRVTGANSYTANYIPMTQKGTPDGVATLTGSGKLSPGQVPDVYGVNQTIAIPSTARTVWTTPANKVSYTNDQTRPITVYVNSAAIGITPARLVGYVDDIPVSTSYATGADDPVAVSFNVPAGSTYSVFGADLNSALNRWREYA